MGHIQPKNFHGLRNQMSYEYYGIYQQELIPNLTQNVRNSEVSCVLAQLRVSFGKQTENHEGDA